MEPSKHGLRDFDVAECLMSEGAIAEYLRLSMEEDSPEDFAEALVDAARARARLSNGAQDFSAENVVSLARSFGYGVSFAPLPAAAAA